MKTNKLCLVLGTRPEIIKMAPLVRECLKRGKDFFIIHTGQHYSPELDKYIFKDLQMPDAKYNLGIGGEPYRKQVGLMVKEIKKILDHESPDWVIVQGDTVSVLAGAVAAKQSGVKLAHHEAGLRSHDTTMLEETNRVVVDHLSDLLFVPTQNALDNLHEEGVEAEKIHLVGNTIVDAVIQNLDIAIKFAQTLKTQNLLPKSYILASAHRAENVDVPERLMGIVEGLRLTSEEFKLPVILPLHPRTKNKLAEFGINLPKNIITINPVGFLELLNLEKHAKLVMTDSGGLQEEAFILGVPCVTMRDNTERPETVECGANVLAGTKPQDILASAKIMVNKNLDFNPTRNPFGDGHAAEKIIAILEKSL